MAEFPAVRKSTQERDESSEGGLDSMLIVRLKQGSSATECAVDRR